MRRNFIYVPLLACFTILACSRSDLATGSTNRVVTLTGDLPIGSGGIDVDAEGNIYAADFGSVLNGKDPGEFIYKITPDGKASAWVSTGLWGASGNDFDSQGNLIQSSIAGNYLSSISPEGVVTKIVESGNGVINPVGVVAMAGDTLYVCNCKDGGSIQKIAPDGTSTRFVTNESGLFKCPNGITSDTDGNLYVANFGNGNVIKITPDGTPALFATIPGKNNGHILFANGVLYVVARSAHQIYQLSLDGELTLLAGSGERGLTDGPALEATLSLTNDLAISPDGKRLYFNDIVHQEGTQILAPVRIRMVILE